MKKFISGILCGLIIFSTTVVKAQNVWTQHNDQGRTGWYPNENTLNQTNVNVNTFGIKFDHPVDEKIVAQPLVIMNVNIPGQGIKNVVYVATQNNTVYAFDADVNTGAYWSANFTNSITPGGPPCGGTFGCRPAITTDIHPSLCGGGYADFDFQAPMGIIGTPVIDTTNLVMYFVTKIVNLNEIGGSVDNHPYNPGNGAGQTPYDEYTYSAAGFHQFLHAIDITTGAEKPNSPVEINPTGPGTNGTGDGQTDASAGNSFHGTTNIIKFDPRRQFVRSGLALNNGTVYIAFAAHCDNNPSHGWIMSFNATSLAPAHVFNPTPNDGRGGVWMSGVAPAIDASGNIYFTSGNSLTEGGSTTNGVYHVYNGGVSSPTLPANRGEGITKLNPDLTLNDYFTPWNYVFLNNADLDFASQAMLIPNTNLLMTGCKNDTLYLFDQNNLTHFNPARNFNLQRVFVGDNAQMHSTFAYFGGVPTPWVYQYSENTQLKQYPVNPATGLGTPITNTTIGVPNGGTGGFLSTSSNGTDPSTAILWAYQSIPNCNANGSNCTGTLYAFDATNVTHMLWSSDLVPADKINIFNKFSCPTVALGNVYLAGNKNHLMVYGAKNNASCVTNQAASKTATAFTNNSTANNVTDGNPATSWTGLPQDVDSIYIDLGGSYDICKVIINWDATGFGKDFDIKVSNNGTTWTIIKSVRGNAATITEFDGATNGRFVSMVGITRGTTNGYSINEFQVFGSPSGSCPPQTGLTAGPGNHVTIFTNQTPATIGGHDASNGPSVELGMKFRSSVNGFITGIRFYKTSVYTGLHVGELFTYPGPPPAVGVRLATANFTGETGSGWQTVTFPSPVAITANTTYIAAYFNADNNYTSDLGYMLNPVLDSNLTELADGTDGNNGVFGYGSAPGIYPLGSFNLSNYWVDPVFSTKVPADPHTQMIVWDAFPGATQYVIRYRPNLSASWITRTSNSNGTVLSALSCNTLYFYTVQAVCSNGSLSVVSQGSFTPTGCPATSCDAFIVRFFNLDLGDIGVAGSTCLNGSVYTLSGSGNDIGGTSDQFQFAYTSFGTADQQVVGQIIQQDASPATNKIGVMVRDSLTNTSRFAYLASLNSGGSFVFEYRSVPNGPVTTVPLTGHALPFWVQIRQSGTSYAAFTSPDNITWTQVVAPVNLNFGKDASNAPHFGMAETSTNNSVLSSGKIDNFLVSGTTPLPITLIGFNAKNINDDHVLVTWTTTMEHLVDHYEVERSVDNSHFEMVAKVAAVGESETLQYYSAIDHNPVAGINYYRLKEIDKDGNFYYSPIVSVTINQPEGLEVYPNPAGSYTNINSRKYPILEVNLYDVTGKLLQQSQAVSGQKSVRLNTTDLLNGVYIIRIKTTTGVYRQKLLKQ